MAQRNAEGDTFTSIVIKGMKLTGLLERAGDILTQTSGQTAARWKVLGGIDEHSKTVAEIARSLNLARQGIQRIADALTRDGLTRFIDNPHDRRSYLLTLTRHGRATLLSIQERQRQWANRVGLQIGKKTLLEIDRALRQLVVALEPGDQQQGK